MLKQPYRPLQESLAYNSLFSHAIQDARPPYLNMIPLQSGQSQGSFSKCGYEYLIRRQEGELCGQLCLPMRKLFVYFSDHVKQFGCIQ